MTRHPLLAVGLVGSLVGGIVSGCSDTAPAASSAAADGAQTQPVWHPRQPLALNRPLLQQVLVPILLLPGALQ